MTYPSKKKFKSEPSSEESSLHSLGMIKVFVVAAVVNFSNAIFGSQNGWLPQVFCKRKCQKCCCMTFPGNTQV